MSQSTFNYERVQSMCLLGTSGAGKSTTLKVLKNCAIQVQRTPIVNFQSYTWKCPTSEKNHLRIWDCSGFKEIQKLSGLHVKRSKGALVFYNSSLKHTFDDLQSWIDLALSKQISPEFLWIIRTQFPVAEPDQQSKPVSREQGVRFATQQGLQHRTLSQFTSQHIKNLYEDFGNLLVGSNLEEYWAKQLIRRSFSEVSKNKKSLNPNIDMFLYASISTAMVGFVLLNYMKTPTFVMK